MTATTGAGDDDGVGGGGGRLRGSLAVTGQGDDGGARTALGRRVDSVWAADGVGAADGVDLGSLAASMSSASSGGPGGNWR